MMKEMRLSELVNQLLAAQAKVQGDPIIVADRGEPDGPAALMHFDAIIEVQPIQIERNPDEESSGEFKEAIVMATGTTASGDIQAAIRLRLK